MKFSIARLLANKNPNIRLSKVSKLHIKEIVDNVKKEFVITLNDNDWMDEHTKNISLEKV